MKSIPRALMLMASVLLLLWVVALARELGSREAREKIAEALELDRPDRVRIKEINRGPGAQAVVEASIDAAFRLVQDQDGKWQVADLRTGDRQWESMELIHTAIRKERTLRTAADMRSLATALEAFRRTRGFYVVADTGSALVDHLAPEYLNSVIRLDAWAREFQYNGTVAHYRLSSLGPDRKPQTMDDIIIENGQFVRGASQ